MSATADDELLPKPGDGDPATQGDLRRTSVMFARRLERIESFCFEEGVMPDGETRPSLQSFVAKADKHVSVMCDWAAAAKKLVKIVITLGAAGTAVAGFNHGWDAARALLGL